MSNVPGSGWSTSWADAELAARNWMRAIGFIDAELTPPGADGGLDVTSASAVAQVKAHLSPVGRPDVQNLYGVASALGKQPLFFSLSGYTAAAIHWASQVSVALFVLDPIGNVSPVNQAAHDTFALRHRAAIRLPQGVRERAQFMAAQQAAQRNAFQRQAQELFASTPFVGAVRRARADRVDALAAYVGSPDAVVALASWGRDGLLAITGTHVISLESLPGGQMEVEIWPRHQVMSIVVSASSSRASLELTIGGVIRMLPRVHPVEAENTRAAFHSGATTAEEMRQMRQRSAAPPAPPPHPPPPRPPAPPGRRPARGSGSVHWMQSATSFVVQAISVMFGIYAAILYAVPVLVTSPFPSTRRYRERLLALARSAIQGEEVPRLDSRSPLVSTAPKWIWAYRLTWAPAIVLVHACAFLVVAALTRLNKANPSEASRQLGFCMAAWSPTQPS